MRAALSSDRLAFALAVFFLACGVLSVDVARDVLRWRASHAGGTRWYGVPALVKGTDF